MSGTPYLHELTLRLAVGASMLDSEIKSKHGDWLVAQQRPDGGFAGREGDSDPYYTAFALRGLWILNRIDKSIASRAGEFLRARMHQRDSIIDLISLIFAAAICELSVGEVVLADDDDWRIKVAQLLASLRTEDGGFAKTPEGRAGSTYQTFLSVLCLELIEQPIEQPEMIEGIYRVSILFRRWLPRDPCRETSGSQSNRRSNRNAQNAWEAVARSNQFQLGLKHSQRDRRLYR